MTQNSYTRACRDQLWFWDLNLPLFIKRRVGGHISSWFLEAAQVLLQAIASDKSPRRLMAKYCMTFFIATLVNSAFGLFWGHIIILHLVLGQALSSSLHMRQKWTELWKLWDTAGQKGGTDFLFSACIFLCAEMGFGVSNISLFRESIYFTSTEFSHANYIVWILQIQQCASRSRISTLKDCSGRAEGRDIKHRMQSWWHTVLSLWQRTVGRLLKLQMCLEKPHTILHCDTLTATNSRCLLQIDIQTTFSGVTLENNEVRCW